jgi:hypothetical protein
MSGVQASYSVPVGCSVAADDSGVSSGRDCPVAHSLLRRWVPREAAIPARAAAAGRRTAGSERG